MRSGCLRFRNGALGRLEVDSRDATAWWLLCRASPSIGPTSHWRHLHTCPWIFGRSLFSGETLHPRAASAKLWIVEDSISELDRLSQELRETEAAFTDEFRRIASGWHLGIGRMHINAVVGPEMITVIYVAFNALCFAVGVAFVFFGGVFVSLGVAIIVGALFSFGAFLAQFYVVAFQREHERLERLFADERDANLKRLLEKRAQLISRIQSLDDSHTGAVGNLRDNGQVPPVGDPAG